MTTELNTEFTKFLKEKRLAMGLTQKQFSILIWGKNKENMIGSYEQGTRSATLKTASLILEKLNCKMTIEEL